MSSYRVLEGWQKEAQGRFAEEYEALLGPDGFECILTEPEDRRWIRDLRPVVERLNAQEELITHLRAENRKLRASDSELRRRISETVGQLKLAVEVMEARDRV